MTVDITEPIAASEETAALRSRVAELEQRLHGCQQANTSASFFAQAPDMLCVASPDGYFTHLNPAWQHATGYSLEELKSKPIIDFIHPDDHAVVRGEMQRVFVNKQATVSFDHRMLCKNGSQVWLRLNASLDAEDDMVYGIAREITQERRAEEGLIESEQRYQRMVANVPGMVYQFALHPDGTATFPFASDGIRALFGVDAEQVRTSALPIIEMTHDDDIDRFQQTVSESAATLEPWLWEGRFVLPTGEEKWINAAAQPERLEDGTILWDGIILDVTERKRTQEQLLALTHTHNQLASAIRNMRAGVVISDPTQPDHPMTFVNPAFTAITGYTADESIGKNCRFLQGPDTDPAAVQAMRDAIATREPVTVTLRNYRKDGTPFWNELVISPVFDQHGTVTNFVGIQTDVSERIAAEQQLKAEITRAQHAEATFQEDIIRAQQAALEELSTPLIPISETTVVMPLIGTMDSRRAQQVMDTLLQGVAETSAHTAILDITGVSVVDTQVANALIRAAQAVKLLGAQVMLTGIRPEVAQTLVGLGVDLSAIVTLSTLQSGIALALKK